MKTCAAVLALLLTGGGCQAAMIATAETDDPLASMRFFDEVGPCVGGARKAEFVKPSAPTIIGCWTVRAGGYLTDSWLDGDQDKIPLAALNHEAI